jgi:hypothetical protein
MSMEIVNGYVCRDCTDVERAKKGEDPAKAQGVVAKAASKDAPGTARDAETLGVNRPLTAGDRGTRVNLLT